MVPPVPNELLRAARAARGWTQEQVAERVRALIEEGTGEAWGIDANKVSRLERGAIRWPGRAEREAFRRLFGVVDDAELGFSPSSTSSTATNPQALRVAIALVVRAADVLLVCRRDGDSSGLTWQFPAGVVKPGAAAEAVAVRETFAETGVSCEVRKRLGTRLHPTTGVLCDYLLCEYLAGDAFNSDPDENAAVAWSPRHAVTDLIPPDRIYPPVLSALRMTP